MTGAPSHFPHQDGHTMSCVLGPRLSISCGDGTRGMGETPSCPQECEDRREQAGGQELKGEQGTPGGF